MKRKKGRALLTFRVKTDILTLRYCVNFIEKDWIWVLK